MCSPFDFGSFVNASAAVPGVKKRPQADCGLGAQNVSISRGTTLIQLRRRSPHGLKQDLTGHGVIRRRLLAVFACAIPGGVLKKASVRLAPAAGSLCGGFLLIFSHHHLWGFGIFDWTHCSGVGGICQERDGKKTAAGGGGAARRREAGGKRRKISKYLRKNAKSA